MANRSERKANAKPENIRKAFHLAWDQGHETAAAALLEAKKHQTPQLAGLILQAFGEVAKVRLSPVEVRQEFIAAWNGGGEGAASTLLKEKIKRCPVLGESYGQVFGEVKHYATRVHA